MLIYARLENGTKFSKEENNQMSKQSLFCEKKVF